MATNVYDSTLFSGDPFYDDYSESKKFLRMLFRPGYAVQARELTQLQTILQNQIERFGSHIFEDGSIVSGSQVVEDTVHFARIETLSGTNTLSEIEGLKIIKSDGDSAKAIVLHTLAATAGDNYDILFYDYIEGGTAFALGDAITTTGDSLTTLYTTTITGESSGFTAQFGGTATLVTVSEGIRFVDGFFVMHSEQRTVPYEITGSATRYFEHPTNTIGFDISKTIVDEDDDTSLVDNAFGSYNYAAPGAHRYKVDLTLNGYDWDPDSLGTSANYSQEDFIEILRLNDGVVVYRSMYPEYAVLEDTLARRTYDESGNYTVRTFDLSLVANGSSASQFDAKLEAGKAYIFGYEFETIAPTSIAIDRARGAAAERSVTTIDFDRTIGNYVNVFAGGGTQSIGLTDFLDDHDLLYLATGASGDWTTGITDGQVIGYGRARQLFDNGSGTYRLYLYDVDMTGSNVFEDVRSFWSATGVSSAAFYVHTSSQEYTLPTGNTKLTDVASSNLLFEVPEGNKVQSIDTLDYNITRYFPNVGFAAGNAVIGTGLSDTEIDFAGVAGFYNIGSGNKSIVLTPGGTALAGNAGKTGTRQFEIRLTDTTYGGTGNVIVDLDVSDTTASIIRTKSLTTQVVTITGPTSHFQTDDEGNYYFNLGGMVDVVSIASVTAGLVAGGTTAAANYFTLDNGQRDNFYDWSRLILKDRANNTVLTGAYEVELTRYLHSGYGPFTVDSYSSVDYDDIPYYTSPVDGHVYDLRDCLDFRPIKITSGGLSNTWTPQIGVDFEGGYTYYQPRSAKVVLNRDRTFGVLYGPYGEAAPIPADSDDAMTLYILKIPPYTHNPTDVGVRFVENKRYTMRDIGRLEQRIEDVEYYTTLSLLEQEAKNLRILDANNVERPKNGLLVDGFKNQGVADITDQWHRAAVDAQRGELRPSFDLYALGATFDAAGASAFASQLNEILTLPYSSTKVAVVQPFVSTTETVNTFGMHNWVGSVKLSPIGDSWFDDLVRPIVRSNTACENDSYIGSGYSFGYNLNWDFWENNWYGKQVINDENVERINSNISSEADADVYGKIPQGFKKSTSNNNDAIKKTIANRTANLSIVPYIAAQNITINASGLKPLTAHYVFFDGVDVTSACTGTLTTNANGVISNVTFALPVNTYKSGEKLLRITDDSSNNLATTTSAADSIFYASGIYSTREDGVQGIRPPILKRSSVRSEIVTTNIINRDIQRKDASNYKAYDPLAQEFTVSPRKYPNGMFITSLRLNFSAKDENLPVGVTIRPMANGFPHPSKIIPGSEKWISSGSVNTGTDPESDYTEFTFDNPVYLAPGNYAFTVETAGKGYVLRAAEIGQDTSFAGTSSDDRVTPSPDVGGLYVAQNSGTWKKNSLKSVYFVLRRAVFSTSARVRIRNSTSNPYDGTTKNLGAYRISVPVFKPSATNVIWHYSSVPNEVIANAYIPLTTEDSIDITNTNAFTVYADLTTTDNAVSPVIDEAMFRFLAIQNNVGAYDSSATITEGNPTPSGATGTVTDSRYISRKVSLRSGFESEDINVYLLANLPQNTSIEVYAKYQDANDSTRFEDLGWNKLTLKTGYAASIATSESDFSELAYETGNIGTKISKFSIKIVMYSSDSAKVPRVKNLRAIALPPA